jgi:hypothetical protein
MLRLQLSVDDERRRGGLKLELLSDAELEGCKAVIRSVAPFKTSVYRRRARLRIMGHYAALLEAGRITGKQFGELVEKFEREVQATAR